MLSRRSFLAASLAAPLVGNVTLDVGFDSGSALDRAFLRDREVIHDLGQNVRLLRGRMTVNQLAEATGATTEMIEAIERGAVETPAGLATRIAETLSVRMSDLFADPHWTQWCCELAELESDALEDGHERNGYEVSLFAIFGRQLVYGNTPCYEESTEWLIENFQCEAVGWCPRRAIWSRLVVATEQELRWSLEDRSND